MEMGGTIVVTSRLAARDPRLLDWAEPLPGDSVSAILFVGDGVYSLVMGSESSSALRRLGGRVKLFGCRHDVESRGLGGRVVPESAIVDFNQMVDLLMKGYSRVVNYL